MLVWDERLGWSIAIGPRGNDHSPVIRRLCGHIAPPPCTVAPFVINVLDGHHNCQLSPVPPPLDRATLAAHLSTLPRSVPDADSSAPGVRQLSLAGSYRSSPSNKHRDSLDSDRLRTRTYRGFSRKRSKPLRTAMAGPWVHWLTNDQLLHLVEAASHLGGDSPPSLRLVLAGAAWRGDGGQPLHRSVSPREGRQKWSDD
ncbi:MULTISPECIES: DUF6292 family protein [Actinoalloteichus]|uniref:DUF6292 family protein n=1 Tax=Actinoalloteichus TaxID=65496 RepID=UPI001E40658B|nr:MULTISPECIES: DUF6292 family protein [Actinoalloteichus]